MAPEEYESDMQEYDDEGYIDDDPHEGDYMAGGYVYGSQPPCSLDESDPFSEA